MTDADKPLLIAKNLARHYSVSGSRFASILGLQHQHVIKAVNGASFSIPRGTTFSIVGESGCGKSTLAHMIVGLQPATHGTMTFAPGRGYRGAMRLQMIFQDPYSSLNPRWRVRDIVGEPLRRLHLRERGEASKRRVDELLDIVGLGARVADRYPHEFSGGQRQRISIARALAAEPEFLVCDEPTSALDVSVQAQILNLLKDLQAEMQLTYLFISHDLSVVKHISDWVAVMYLGRIVEQAPTAELFDRPKHPYTQFLLDTVPDIDNPKRDREAKAIELPNAISPPSGCPYHPRCGRATSSCQAKFPDERKVGYSRVQCHHPAFVDAPV